MSREQHDDNCPGCRPVLLDLTTKQPLPDDSPEMVACNEVWDGTNLIERQAWHRVTCQNSRLPGDLRLAGAIADRMKTAMAKIEKPK